MDQHINVLALTKYDRLGASSRHRFLDYIPLLAERGIIVTPMPLLSDAYVERRLAGLPLDFLDVARSFVRRAVELAVSHRFDVLWIEGELFPRLPALAERLLELFGRPYVVDLDDAIFHTYDQHPWPSFRQLLGRKIDVVLNHAAAVTVGNEYLAERALRAGAGRVLLVPTTVDDRAYARINHAAGDKLTFGWIGSPATQHYLQTIETELMQLCHSLPATVRLIGLERHHFSSPDVSLRQWSEATEIEELASCDIGLAPLFDGLWERGKCGLKAIQYMAAGLPVLAARAGALPTIVVNGETGFLYRNGAEFTALAERLGADGELRSRLGMAGRRRAAACYSVHHWVETVRNVLLAARRH